MYVIQSEHTQLPAQCQSADGQRLALANVLKTPTDEMLREAERDAEEQEDIRLERLRSGKEEEARAERILNNQRISKFKTQCRPDSLASNIGQKASQTQMPKPKPAALNLESSKPIEFTTQRQSLFVARPISRIMDVPYPASIILPDSNLQQPNTSKGFRYDRSFLLQFSGLLNQESSVNRRFLPWRIEARNQINPAEPASHQPLHKEVSDIVFYKPKSALRGRRSRRTRAHSAKDIDICSPRPASKDLIATGADPLRHRKAGSNRPEDIKREESKYSAAAEVETYAVPEFL